MAKKNAPREPTPPTLRSGSQNIVDAFKIVDDLNAIQQAFRDDPSAENLNRLKAASRAAAAANRALAAKTKEMRDNSRVFARLHEEVVAREKKDR